MNTFFVDLFTANHRFNQAILEEFYKSSELVSPRLVELQSHIINAHTIWNSKISAQSGINDRWMVHKLDELVKLDLQNFEGSITILNQFDLDIYVEYALSSGKECINSVRDILFQIINHSTYHRGQVATEFRNCGLEPLLTEWIVYKMKRTRH